MKNILVKIQRKDIFLTDKYLCSTPFHPGYWVQKRLTSAISRTAPLAKGILLDVGCGLKPYEAHFLPFVGRYYGCEYLPESGYRGNRADFCADALSLPFSDDSVDTILCTEVLEHLNDPERAIAEFCRVLKPGGTLIATAPFAFPVHDELDFFRYTPKGLAAIMKRQGLRVESVEPLSGTGLSIAILFNSYLFSDLMFWNKALYPVGVLIRPAAWLLTAVFNVLGRIAEVVLPSRGLPFGNLTVASKPKPAQNV
jgi:SAM-dependent methyltransferase